MESLKDQVLEAIQKPHCWIEVDPEGSTVMDYPDVEIMAIEVSKATQAFTIQKLITENESILLLLETHGDTERVKMPVRDRIELLKKELQALEN